MGMDAMHDGGRRAGIITGLLAGTLAAGALAVALALRIRSVLEVGTGPWRVDGVVELGVMAAGLGVALWLACSALVAAACLVARAAGASWRAGERLVHRYAPQVVRRALVMAVGASIGLGVATGASAAAPEPAPPTAAVVTTLSGSGDLGWVVTGPPADPVPPAPTAEPATPVVADPPSAVASPAPLAEPVTPVVAAAGAATRSETPVLTAAPAPGPGTVVVARGDSLWAIAARHLPPGATDAQVAAAWPRWYEANAGIVGPDPDVLVPGQVLTVPTVTDGASL